MHLNSSQTLQNISSGANTPDDIFNVTPIPLWLEDYSEIKQLFEKWRAEGVTDLVSFLNQDHERIRQCASRIKVLNANQRVLELFEFRTLQDLLDGLDLVFSKDMLTSHIEELAMLWEGQHSFSNQTINYTATGRRLNIQLSGRIVPGHEDSWDRVLIATEDVTDKEIAQQKIVESERFSKGLFEHSPISLWVEDFSAVKAMLDDLRMRGISDFRVFTDVHPEFVSRCMSEIRVLDVNNMTLRLFGAPSKPHLMQNLNQIFRDKMEQPFREQLIDLWNGVLFQVREVVNYSLEGQELHLMLQFSVLPGHEDDWSLVQVALTDITARKAAEAYLEFLGKHDSLTKLYNRSYFTDELIRLQRQNVDKVAVIIADLNNLKFVNDSRGHAAGDEMLRRVGEILGKVVKKPCHAFRIGGDEFALTLPGYGESEVEILLKEMSELIELNNQFYSNVSLSLAVGAAIRQSGENMESVARRADVRMYTDKRAFHEARIAKM
ncbi:sensor domain-containing diguanylate cyclase [Aureimonas fodinaquatilis]|uniref:Sensor domain-containing diguanylate cyclase n=1 Tax=Aureimonas fodinaquatilis TaxID=2565783 RepID=A0A5B0E087_9HYPH|nr:sensor domain-containing diguanylate cyclase [Aureimonas fodinaquatilis]KAA0972106.1 sensor domain-containing diguanylate cyclase [Aureimonas fodinaquatilis]